VEAIYILRPHGWPEVASHFFHQQKWVILELAPGQKKMKKREGG